MKKLLFIFMMLLSANSFIASAAEKREDIPLNKKDSENYDKNAPRTLIPLMCFYEDGVVSLEVLGDLGEIRMIITNQATGEAEVNENGSFSVDVPTISGTYLVQIVTEDGTLYYGTYTL